MLTGTALVGLDDLPVEVRDHFSVAASLMLDRFWRASAPHTRRALKADLTVYVGWCRANGQPPLPASPGLVVWFLDEMKAAGRSAATLARYRASLAKLHQLLEMDDPCRHQLVALTLRGIRRSVPRPRGQAPALRLRGNVAEPAMGDAQPGSLLGLLDACGGDRAGLRDRAVLATAYDSGLRRSELVALTLGDLVVDVDGTAIVRVARSKTDPEGRGSHRFLSRRTVIALKSWIAAAGLGDQADRLFRAVDRWDVIGAPLSPAAIPAIFRRAAARAAVRARHRGDGEAAEVYSALASQLRGHSTRVGIVQDMTAQGADLLAIMQAFDWRSSKMPLQYTKALSARTSAIARLLSASDS